MNFEHLLFLLAFPLIWPFIAKFKWHQTISWQEMGLHVAIPIVLISIVYFCGRYGQTADVEIWNGQVTSKHRDHGHYVESYRCNCYTTCSGTGEHRTCTEHCSTCYRDHYTVKWWLATTLGSITLQHLDRTSRSVYNTPDPAHYIAAYVGEPCSTLNSYTNYVKAVPDSLFNFGHGVSIENYMHLIPAYPTVHSYYKVQRVLTPGLPSVLNVPGMNERLGLHLRDLGPTKQANIILVLVNTPDQMYRHALEQAWLGGKKNDIIVIVGVPEYPKIAWVDTITLGSNAGNSLMTVTMRDRLMDLKDIGDGLKLVDTIAATVGELFDRKPMQDYEYLKDEINPPLWVVIMALILGIGGSLGLTVLFHREDFFGTNSYRRYYR